jgi:hypothetical protein
VCQPNAAAATQSIKRTSRSLCCSVLVCQVVETIAELAQIMRDLSTLVVEQGTMLDRIDGNIGQAAVKVGMRVVRRVWFGAGVAAPGLERPHVSVERRHAC